jgi:DNA-binding NtrC family response regulator
MSEKKKIRVLVVDDEVTIRESLKGFLEEYEYDVVAAGTAEESLAYISESEFSAAIIDLRLPRMNGETLIKRANQLRPEIRFIIHTGSIDYTLSKELISIGMSKEDVFYKPVHNLGLVVEGIKRILDSN